MRAALDFASHSLVTLGKFPRCQHSIYVFKKKKSNIRALGGVRNMVIHSPATRKERQCRSLVLEAGGLSGHGRWFISFWHLVTTACCFSKRQMCVPVSIVGVCTPGHLLTGQKDRSVWRSLLLHSSPVHPSLAYLRISAVFQVPTY